MVAPNWNARFFESTRGRIVELLRRGSRTVDELARALDLTDNAVRLHLTALERDGIVRSIGPRREGTVGKPAILYEISPSAEPALSRAYLPFLTTLLRALGERLSATELRALMREVGHRLAGTPAKTPDDLAGRARLASGILNELGGATVVEREGDVVRIRGCGCPLSAAVAEREEVCAAVQTLVRDVVGANVRERCDRGERPSCRFEFRAADDEV
jgi:predicted ArsR family transcriptional regulator